MLLTTSPNKEKAVVSTKYESLAAAYQFHYSGELNKLPKEIQAKILTESLRDTSEYNKFLNRVAYQAEQEWEQQSK